MFAHHRFGAAAFAVLDGVDHDAVMILPDHQDLVRFRQRRLRHHETRLARRTAARRRDRSADQRRAARQFGEQRVKARVHRHIGGERFDRNRRLANQLVEIAKAFLQRLEAARAGAALGGKAGGEPFQRAAQFDRIEDVAFGKRLHHEAAGGDRLQQAFLLQPHQRQPHRRPRDARDLDRLQLGDAFARPQPPGQDQVAQRELRAHGLRDGASASRSLMAYSAAWTVCGAVSCATMRSITRRAHIAPASMLRL